MSAADHDRRAVHHDAKAAQHDQLVADTVDPSEPGVPLGPSAHTNFSARHRKHAKDHRAAARALEQFEDEACREIAPEDRAECPLKGNVLEANDREGRIVLRLTSHVSSGEIRKRATCHIAFGRVQGREGMPGCPLYVEGVRLLPPEKEGTIELTVADPLQLDELRRRAHDHAGQ
jgi:hypothetical protein